MGSSNVLYIRQWTDDHLDLLNYARKLNDAEWQADLLRALADRESLVDQEWKQRKKDELWRRYDRINVMLLELYSELQSAGHEDQQELMARLMLLKQQRLEISRQLATIG